MKKHKKRKKKKRAEVRSENKIKKLEATQLAKQKREQKAANKKTKPPAKRKINLNATTSQLSTQKNMEDRTCSKCGCSFNESSFKNEWLSCKA